MLGFASQGADSHPEPMAEKPHRIEVYQELRISLDAASREEACMALGRCAPNCPWHRATDVEERIDKDYDTGRAGVVAFERDATGGVPAVRVVLWPVMEEDSPPPGAALWYRLGNIVPVDPGELGVHGYNDALEEFLRDVVEPAREALGVEMEISPREQTMTDWTSKDAADALHLFTAAANMSTGASHPADAARWRAFVIADHRAQGTLEAGPLKRWLIEVDRWPADIAAELVSDWEKGRELFADYDESP